MKRSIPVLAAVAVLATSMSALADNGDIRENNGKVTINTHQANKYTTVLIVKGDKTAENIDNISADEIVYINQSSSTYGSAVDFLLKSDVIGAKKDTYTVKMGGSEESTVFTTNIDLMPDDVKLELVEAEGNSAAYKAEDVNLGAYHSLKIVPKDEPTALGGLKFTGYETYDGSTNFALQLNTIYGNYDYSKFDLYLSADTITNETADADDLTSIKKGGND